MLVCHLVFTSNNRLEPLDFTLCLLFGNCFNSYSVDFSTSCFRWCDNIKGKVSATHNLPALESNLIPVYSQSASQPLVSHKSELVSGNGNGNGKYGFI